MPRLGSNYDSGEIRGTIRGKMEREHGVRQDR